ELRLAADHDPQLQQFREAHRAQNGIYVERLGRGTDAATGPWLEIRLSAAPEVQDLLRDLPAVVRLRSFPLAIEVPDERPWGRAKPKTFTENFLWWMRRAALGYGWSEEEAFMYLIENRIPEPSPIVVRTLQTGASRTIAVLAQAHASPTSVALEFAKAKAMAAGRDRGRGRSPDPRTLAWGEHVERETAANKSKRPPWLELMEGFEVLRPGQGYGSVPEAATAYTRYKQIKVQDTPTAAPRQRVKKQRGHRTPRTSRRPR
ncbi:MAG TPA: hypothetical protein VFQ05_16215, partial [Candidatus Eisenbacteria bacterium]|nr:hypothetical protein [Candidatus Eisenbacteria bacterium]